MAPLVLAWGANGSGQCCSGEDGPKVEQRPRVVNACLSRGVSTGTPILAVAAGESHTLLLTGYGTVFAWGRTREGQLGLGDLPETVGEVRVPTRLESLRPWRISQVACGSKHCAAVSTCGKAFEWGLLLPLERAAPEQAWAARRGGLGRDFQEDLNQRQQRIVADSWSRYLKNDLYGDDRNDALSVLSAADCLRVATHTPRMAEVLEGSHALTVACGYAHTVVALAGGALRAAGYGEKGQLGNGERCPSARFVTVQLPAGSTAAAGSADIEVEQRRSMLACGQNHTAAITSSGELLAWGLGVFGQLGLGMSDKKEQKLPARVLVRGKVVQVACGDHHTVVLLEDGKVLTFGHRDAVGGESHHTRLPELKRELLPVSGQRAERIFAGGTGCFALVRSAEAAEQQASLEAWGYNQRFQLGRYTAELQLLRPGPTALPRLAGAEVRAFSAGASHCVAVAEAPSSCVLPPEVGEPFFGSWPLLAALRGAAAFDVAVLCADSDQPLGAHRCVLAARCPGLAAALRGRELDLRPASHAAAAALLEYLYTDHCRASASVAAELRPLADRLSLARLAAGVASATETESVAEGRRWVRSADGRWQQVDAPSSAGTASVASTYAADLEALVAEGGASAEDEDYLRLRVGEIGGGESRTVHVARALLLSVDFFRAFLEGDFAEAACVRQGSAAEVIADSADAFVLCLRILATGNYGLLPAGADDMLAVLVEAHRLGLPDIVSAAESALGLIALQLSVAVEDEASRELRAALSAAAGLYGLPQVAAALGDDA